MFERICLRNSREPHSMIPCSECNIGQMHKTKVTYFTSLGENMVTVPDFPAWVCDICGKREYDHIALDQLALLLSPLSKLPKIKSHKNLSSNKEKDTLTKRISSSAE